MAILGHALCLKMGSPGHWGEDADSVNASRTAPSMLRSIRPHRMLRSVQGEIT
jgi:hypothetical protein